MPSNSALPKSVVKSVAPKPSAASNLTPKVRLLPQVPFSTNRNSSFSVPSFNLQGYPKAKKPVPAVAVSPAVSQPVGSRVYLPLDWGSKLIGILLLSQQPTPPIAKPVAAPKNVVAPAPPPAKAISSRPVVPLPPVRLPLDFFPKKSRLTSSLNLYHQPLAPVASGSGSVLASDPVAPAAWVRSSFLFSSRFFSHRPRGSVRVVSERTVSYKC